ncbi:MAG TPA: hypothetical protein VH595_22160 [Verrucomicrobiae bacterium]|nr:hypothetical protein [Verrucomicrobiae bacterium]
MAKFIASAAPDPSSGDSLVRLARERFKELSYAEERIFWATGNGTNFYYLQSDKRDILTNSQGWPSNGVIRADRLAWLCTDAKAAPFVTFRGIDFGGVRVEGDLLLGAATVSFPIYATNCAFTGDINLTGGSVRYLGLDHCLITNLSAEGLKTEGDIDLANGFMATGQVDLSLANIGGRVNCWNGHFTGSNVVVFDMENANVKGPVSLTDGFLARGEVNLFETQIGGVVNCDGGHFFDDSTNHYAIDLQQSTIDGFVFMRGDSVSNFSARGEVDLSYVHAGGVECSRAEIVNPIGIALSLNGGTFKGDVFLRNGVRVKGQVLIQNAAIGGSLDCSSDGADETHFECYNTNPITSYPTMAFDARGAKIDGYAALAGNVEVNGGATFQNAAIGQNFNCAGGKFVNSNSIALSVSSAHVGEDVYLTDGFDAQGEVNLLETQIGGELDCDGGYFDADNAMHYAIEMQEADIGGFVSMRGDSVADFSARGQVDLGYSHIGGLLCGGGEISNPSDVALNLDGGNVKGDVSLVGGFRIEGQTAFQNAGIGGNLVCSSAGTAGTRFRFYSTNATATYPMSAFDASGAKIDGYVSLGDGLEVDGGVMFQNATIGQNFNCTGGKFVNSNLIALSLGSAHLSGSVYFTDGFDAQGQVSLFATDVGGMLVCDGGHFHAGGTNSFAISLQQANVEGFVFMRGDSVTNFSAQGEVDLSYAHIAGLQCSEGKIANPEGIGLNLNGGNIKGDIDFDGFETEGQVTLENATVGGNLICSSGGMTETRFRFYNTNYLVSPTFAFDAVGAKIDGYAALAGNVEVDGGANFQNATVEQNLNCIGGRFFNSNAVALLLSRANINGSVYLCNGFTSEGEVALDNATIGQDLNCSGGAFSAHNDWPSLYAYGARIGGNTFLGGPYPFEGSVLFFNATIRGDLNCAGAMFNGGRIQGAPNSRIDPDPATRPFAFSAAGAQIDGSVLLNFIQAHSVVSFEGVKVGRRFQIRHSYLPSGPAGHPFESDFPLSLRDAKIEALDDDAESWPEAKNLNIEGLVYDRFSDLTLSNASYRVDWLHLDGQTNFLPQPYEELATVLRASGFEDEATTVLIRKNRDQSRFTKRFSLSWWWYNVFGRFINYGYRPIPALWTTVGFILAGWFIFSFSYGGPWWLTRSSAGNLRRNGYKPRNLFTPADTDKAFIPHTELLEESYPRFNGFVYSLETFVPLVKLGVGDYWRPNANRGPILITVRKNVLLTGGGLLRLYYWIHLIAGWILTTLLVGALTGLIKT